MHTLRTIACVIPLVAFASVSVYDMLREKAHQIRERNEAAFADHEEAAFWEVTQEIQSADPEVMHRLQLKEEAICEYIAGRVEFSELVDRFENISHLYVDDGIFPKSEEHRQNLLEQIDSYLQIRIEQCDQEKAAIRVRYLRDRYEYLN